MSDRISAMRAQGLFACPTWCAQPVDEHHNQEHVSDWRAYQTSWNDTIAVRLLLPWSEDDGGGCTEMIQQQCSGNTREGVRFDADDRHAIEDLIFRAEVDLEDYDEQWAYDGAEDDEAEYHDEVECLDLTPSPARDADLPVQNARNKAPAAAPDVATPGSPAAIAMRGQAPMVAVRLPGGTGPAPTVRSGPTPDRGHAR